MKPRFTELDAIAAADEWGFNCGPAAVAAICGLSIAELRPHLLDFEQKQYTNPTLMWGILRSLGLHLGLRWRMQTGTPGGLSWPNRGLARVQWEGPWMADGVPMAARYRQTHWVGCHGLNRNNIGIWDVNCLNNGSGWVSLEDWTALAVPFITRSIKRANGKWHLTHSVEIELPRTATA